MNCAAFERWLDEGMPEADTAGASTHAAGCARCAAQLAAAEAIEAGLSRATFSAPPALTDAVMARVAAIEARRILPAAPVIGHDAFPWWARAATDPAAVTATLLCALMVWQWDAVARSGIVAAVWLGNLTSGLTLPGSAWTPSLGLQIALAAMLLPAAIWLGRAAFHASERWVERSAGWRV